VLVLFYNGSIAMIRKDGFPFSLEFFKLSVLVLFYNGSIAMIRKDGFPFSWERQKRWARFTVPLR
jgi:hypothetical protein